MIIFDVRRNSAIKVCYELLWYPNTYDFAVGGGGGTVRKESPSLLGPFGLPGWGGLPFLVSPGRRGRAFIFLLLVSMGGVRLGVIGR